jgi:hypothetical protein
LTGPALVDWLKQRTTIQGWWLAYDADQELLEVSATSCLAHYVGVDAAAVKQAMVDAGLIGKGVREGKRREILGGLRMKTSGQISIGSTSFNFMWLGDEDSDRWTPRDQLAGTAARAAPKGVPVWDRPAAGQTSAFASGASLLLEEAPAATRTRSETAASRVAAAAATLNALDPQDIAELGGLVEPHLHAALLAGVARAAPSTDHLLASVTGALPVAARNALYVAWGEDPFSWRERHVDEDTADRLHEAAYGLEEARERAQSLADDAQAKISEIVLQAQPDERFKYWAWMANSVDCQERWLRALSHRLVSAETVAWREQLERWLVRVKPLAEAAAAQLTDPPNSLGKSEPLRPPYSARRVLRAREANSPTTKARKAAEKQERSERILREDNEWRQKRDEEHRARLLEQRAAEAVERRKRRQDQQGEECDGAEEEDGEPQLEEES